jgi:pimeloyl-ACP methyl ester carboxylesterase
MDRAPQVHSVNIDGLRLHYLDYGNEAAPPLLLLHGITGNGRSWDPVAPTLAEHFHVVALDQRGHGESDWADDYAPVRMAEDVAAFVDTMGWPAVSVAGHSMGGILSWMYAARRPERVTRLVIEDFGPETLVAPGSDQVMERVRAPEDQRFADPEEAVRLARQMNPRPDPDVQRQGVVSRLVQDADGRWRYRHDPRLTMFRTAAPTTAEQWEELRRVRCPTLILRAAEAAAVAADVAERMVEAMQNARLVEIPQTSHTMHLDNPHGFLAVVQPFLLEGSPERLGAGQSVRR